MASWGASWGLAWGSSWGFAGDEPELPVAPTILTLALAKGQLGRPYSRGLVVTGTPPIVFTLSDGALPSGLALNEDTGVISGTPDTLETAEFEITATNDEGFDVQTYEIEVVEASGVATVSGGGVGYAGVTRTPGVGGPEIGGP